MKTKTLPSGTIVHINGIPIELTQATEAQSESWDAVEPSEHAKPKPAPGAKHNVAGEATASKKGTKL
jgi:hypothetical protein